MSYIIEEEHGTFTGTRRHRHNGYYAGDFRNSPMRTPEQLTALARMRPPTPPRPEA